jgi:hypothetical protein
MDDGGDLMKNIDQGMSFNDFTDMSTHSNKMWLKFVKFYFSHIGNSDPTRSMTLYNIPYSTPYVEHLTE